MQKSFELGIAARVGMGLAAATGVLALSSCSGESAPDIHHNTPITAPAEQGDPSEIPSTTAPTSIAAPSNKDVLANPDLMASGYPTLPPAVKRITSSAVEIYGDATQPVDYYDKRGNLLRSGSEFAYIDKAKTILAGGGGSGSVVETSNGKQVILTGGHVAAPNADACKETTVNFQSSAGSDSESLTVEKQAYQFGGSLKKETTASPDKAVIITEPGEKHEAVPLLPKVSLNPGDVLFTANYEPKENGDERSPTSEDNPDPAIYNMMVLGRSSSGLTAVLERGNSYGKSHDNRTRKGASGGLVVNSNGELVATVEGGLNNNDKPTAEDIQFELGMLALENDDDTLRGINAKEGDHISYLQPITQGDVDKLAREAEESPNCTPRPHKKVIQK